MKILLILILGVISSIHALLKTCSPTFHETFLSGGDEIGMRWEYCTKMTFSQQGFAEWHSMATYRDKHQFDKLFMNYLFDHKSTEPLSNNETDPFQHLLQIDLAIYDEAQWAKMMQQTQLLQVKKVADQVFDAKVTGEDAMKGYIGDGAPGSRRSKIMTCEERLSHAIHVDKIKIYPNSTAIIEKTKKRYIQESFEDRVGMKHVYNPYNLKYGAKEDHMATDFRENHDRIQEQKDQQWYFVLADCKGTLEIMQDEVTQREHLLGLGNLWQDIKASDYTGFEDMINQVIMNLDNLDADSFQETNLLMENVRNDNDEPSYQRQNQISQNKKEGVPDQDDFNDFNFDDYAEDHHLETLSEYAQYAKEHKLKLKNMPVKVQLQIFNTGSHFSEDKYNLAILYAVLLMVFVGLTILNHRKYAEERDRFEEEDSPLYFTFGSLNMIASHCTMKCIHNFYYSQDGIGSMLCEMFAHIMLVFSRITLITILIAFAFGWQVIYQNTLEVKKKIQYIYLFTLFMTAYDDYALSAWIEAHPSDLFHLFNSSIQWTFYFTKFVEYCIFLFALWRSNRVSNKKLDESMTEIEDDQSSEQRELELQSNISTGIYAIRKGFFKQLFIVGTIFFASTPLSTIIGVNYIQESNQQMFQTLVVTIAQIIVYAFLLYMLTNKSSKYYSATFRGQAILPGKVS